MDFLKKHIFLFIVLLSFTLSAMNENADKIPDKITDNTADEYSFPIRFDAQKNGAKILPIQLEYRLENGNQLHLGNYLFTPDSFSVQVLREENHSRFLLKWPAILIAPKVFEIIGRTGGLIASISISDAQIYLWRKTASAELKSKYSLALNLTPEILKSLQNAKEPLRFCLSGETEESMTRMCTTHFQMSVSSEKALTWVKAFQSLLSPRVIVFNEEAPLADMKAVDVEHPVTFYAELSTGETYEFVARPDGFDLVELVDLPEENKIKVVAFGSQPTLPVKVLTKDQAGYFSRVLKWQPTIGDFRKFWEVKIPKNKPLLYVQGDGAGLFRQEISFSFLPNQNLSVFADDRTVKGTYVDGVKVFGRLQNPEHKVSSKQNSVEMESDRDFLWRFRARDRGELNKSHLLLSNGKRSYYAFHEVYKGYPGEISTRLGLVFGSGRKTNLSTAFTGELSFNYWFENILGWSNYYLSRQRWGMSFKSYASLNKIRVGDVLDEAAPRFQSFDLKYRLTPGIWGRDESWGLSLNYLNFEFPSNTSLQGQMLGGGLFWARSMPLIFDDLFNLIPILRYPKWVDLDFIYYATALNKNATLRQFGGSSQLGNWALNFHGKVMWTKQFFGEGGFGIKSVNFAHKVNIASDDPDVERITNLTFSYFTFYGSMGLGWSF